MSKSLLRASPFIFTGVGGRNREVFFLFFTVRIVKLEEVSQSCVYWVSVTNQTWVSSPSLHQSQFIDSEFGQEKYSIYCKAPNMGPNEKNGHFMLKRPKFPYDFGGQFLKTR